MGIMYVHVQSGSLLAKGGASVDAAAATSKLEHLDSFVVWQVVVAPTKGCLACLAIGSLWR